MIGTPSTLQGATVYLVTASNSGGSTSCNLTISVIEQPPSGLIYANQINPEFKIVSQTKFDQTPTHSGGTGTSVAPPSCLPLTEALAGVILEHSPRGSQVYTYVSDPPGKTMEQIGLTFDKTTGRIYGTATALQYPRVKYTVSLKQVI